MSDGTGPAEAGRALDGRRLVVIGASSGIGRALVVAARTAGAAVVAAARRSELLDELAGQTGAVPVPCDVLVPADLDRLGATAVDALGGVDALVYATGINHLALLAETTPDDWHRLLSTNVVGASLATGVFLEALRASGGRVAYLSSHSVARPWAGLGAYVASKAALDALAAAWREEERDVDFGRIVVGPTLTGMADAWDPDRAAAFFARWEADGHFLGIEPLPAEAVADVVVGWLADPEPPTDVHLLDHLR